MAVRRTIPQASGLGPSAPQLSSLRMFRRGAQEMMLSPRSSPTDLTTWSATHTASTSGAIADIASSTPPHVQARRILQLGQLPIQHQAVAQLRILLHQLHRTGLWVEVTFEIFTAVIVAYRYREMGIVSKAEAESATYIAVMLFFLTAVIGVGLNLY